MLGPWSPLRIRIFRALWIAGLVSNIGTFMHIASAAWTMTTLSDSPTLVGLVQTAWAVPGFLLALYAGAFADMVDRRRLISAASFLALVIAAALAILQWSGGLTAELLILGTFLESVALTLSAPAFMAITPELVDTERLPQAIGLDAVSRNIAQSIGPAFAGAIIAAINPGAVFALNAISFVGI
ncbi:MAG: MFS transporter, partial [Actinobacteria bacterium]|nr:MFS transporter [Actinomycetota bacterium]